MELDDMKNAWLALEGRLDRQEALQLHAFRESRSDRLRAGLRPLRIARIVQIIVGALLALTFAPFWVGHLDTPHLVVIGVSLHLYALMLIIGAARDLYLIQRIDYAAPVLDIQRRLTELRTWLLRSAPLYGAIGCFIWIPFTLWFFQVAFDADVYAHAPQVVYVFVACGALCLALLLGALRWVRDPRRAKFARWFENSMTGRSFEKSQRLVDEVVAFGREE